MYMYRSKKFENQLVIPRDRNSVLTEIVVPEDLDKEKRLDFDIDKENRTIKFINAVNSGSPYIVTEKYGVHAETRINCFFVKGGLVMELIVGTIYLEGEDGKVFSIDDNGNKKEVTYGLDKISWFNCYDYIRHNLRIMVSYRYNLPENDTAVIDEYINNLAYTLDLEAIKVRKDGDYARMKVVQYFTDLGADIFEFKTLDLSEETDVDYIPKSDTIINKEEVAKDDEEVEDYEEDEEDAGSSTGSAGYKKTKPVFSDEEEDEEDKY